MLHTLNLQFYMSIIPKKTEKNKYLAFFSAKKRRTQDRDHICPRKPKIFTIWVFTENVF